MEWFRRKTLHLGICAIGMLLACNFTHAQIWPKIYGDNIHALIKDISESYDKGFYLTAFTYTFQGENQFGWIIKTDVNGNILWDKKFGVGNNRVWFSSSYITSDNGLIISGITNKYGAGDYDPLFIKTNICGEIDWCLTLVCPDINFGTDIIQTSEGSYIGLLTYYGEGETYSRISLVKMDHYGEPIWIQRCAQGDPMIENEEAYNLILTSSENYLISGSCDYPGWSPYFILTDTSGFQIWDIIWSSAYGHVFQTVEHQPGQFYGIGFKIPPGFNNLPAIFKFNEFGNQLDEFLILGGDTIYQGGGGAILTINDSTLLTSIVYSNISNSEIYKSEVIMIDTLNKLIDRRMLLVEDRSPTSMLLTSDQKILVAGNYVTDGNWDIYLWKMNSDLEDDSLYTKPLTYDSLCPYEIQSDTVDLDCGVFVNIDELPTKEEYESTIKISPNPARDWVVLLLPDVVASGAVVLEVYNVFGREMETERQGDREIRGNGVNLDNRMASLDVSGFSPGMYIAVIRDQNAKRYTGKFLVIP